MLYLPREVLVTQQMVGLFDDWVLEVCEWNCLCPEETDVRMKADVQEIYWRGGDAGKEKEKSVGRSCMGAIHVKVTGVERRKMLVHNKKVLPRRSGVNLVTATQALLVFRLL